MTKQKARDAGWPLRGIVQQIADVERVAGSARNLALAYGLEVVNAYGN
jgi:hypothetical protein